MGGRLAQWALAKTYGKDIVPSGPLYKGMTRKGNKVFIGFAHLGKGLMAKGAKLEGFAIAGADKQFVWAEAKINGDVVEVWSPKVGVPVAVRYAWAPNPRATLFNKDGLPATPFRTDDWELK